jgi:DnaK suppressor protein
MSGWLGRNAHSARAPLLAAEIVAGPTKSVIVGTIMARTDNAYAAVRVRLESRRKEIEDWSEATADDRSTVELDQQRQGRLSRMDALQGQAMAQEAARRRQMELDRIDAALGRLDADEYGYCLACGEEIAPARLDADPAIPTCVDCARGAHA